MRNRFIRASVLVGVVLLLFCRALHSQIVATGPSTAPPSDPAGFNDPHSTNLLPNADVKSQDSLELQNQIQVLRHQRNALQAQLADLLATKGAQHPDVLRTQRQLARVEQELLDAGGMPAPATAPSTQPSAKLPDWDKWTVHASRISSEPFQYKLLPDLVEQTQGNAVPLYLIARRFWPDEKTTNDVLYPQNGKFDYLDTPIDEFPRETAEKLLAAYSDTLLLIDQAARQTSAYDWPDVRSQPKLIASRTDLMHAANLLRFRARYQVSLHRWDEAAHSLQTSFAMARHEGSLPDMYQALLEANNLSATLKYGVSEWINRDSSPNLFWALSDLPHPFVEVAPIAQYERAAVGRSAVDRASRGEDPQEPWVSVIGEMINQLHERRSLGRLGPQESGSQAKQLIASADSRARKYLIAAGMPTEKVAAVTSDEAVGRYICLEARSASDQLWKSGALPYPQAEEQMQRTWRTLAPDRLPLVDNPLFQLNQVGVWFDSPELKHIDYRIPMLLRSRYMLSQADRTIALYQAIEALRDYSARHDGQPPRSLEQVTDLPIPLDPITGNPFVYSAERQTARIEALTPGYWRTGWRVELTFVN